LGKWGINWELFGQMGDDFYLGNHQLADLTAQGLTEHLFSGQ
jgi:hypothetical protein